MAIIGNPILIGGGSGGFAAIQVNYPEGSICTCSNGTKIMTAKTTTGRYTFFIPKVTLPSTWTLECSDGTNSDSQTATITAEGDLLTVTLAYFKTPLNVNSWDTISQAAQRGVGDTYWDVGDTKEIVLNGAIGNYCTLDNYTTCVYILDFNHPINKTIADNNIIFGGFKTANGIDICLVDSGYNQFKSSGKYFNMNHVPSRGSDYNTTYGGWKGCDLRYDILGATETPPSPYNVYKSTTATTGTDATILAITNPVANTLMAALPTDFRNVLRLHTHYVDNKGDSGSSDANVTQVIDAMFLLSEFEVFGVRTFANSYEQNHQKQMAYYANGNSKKKYRHDATSTVAEQLESSKYDYNSFCSIDVNGYNSIKISGCSLGIAPAVKV